jgi:hypothetical protein
LGGGGARPGMWRDPPAAERMASFHAFRCDMASQ